MKMLTATLIACALLAGCATESAPGGTNRTHPRAGDGTTPETAVRIRTFSDIELNREIARWLRRNYPQFNVMDQEIVELRGNTYHVVSIAGAGQSTKRIYFDISMYAKRTNDPNPNPLPLPPRP
jgi:hypothetical protein